ATPQAAGQNPKPAATNTGRVNTNTVATTRPVVELNQDRLLIGGRSFFFRGARVADAPLRTLRDAHLNTVWFDYATPAAQLDEAVRLGFWLVPSLPVSASDPRLASANVVGSEVSRFPAGDAVLFWDLGGGLMEEQKDDLGRIARAVRTTDVSRPIGGDVW